MKNLRSSRAVVALAVGGCVLASSGTVAVAAQKPPSNFDSPFQVQKRGTSMLLRGFAYGYPSPTATDPRALTYTPVKWYMDGKLLPNVPWHDGARKPVEATYPLAPDNDTEVNIVLRDGKAHEFTLVKYNQDGTPRDPSTQKLYTVGPVTAKLSPGQTISSVRKHGIRMSFRGPDGTYRANVTKGVNFAAGTGLVPGDGRFGDHLKPIVLKSGKVRIVGTQLKTLRAGKQLTIVLRSLHNFDPEDSVTMKVRFR